MSAARRALTERIWANVPSELESYGSLIDQLLGWLTEAQLEAFAIDYCDENDPACDGCGEETPASDLRPGGDGEPLCPECFRAVEAEGASDGATEGKGAAADDRP